MMQEVPGYEEQYTAKANRFGVILLLCHLPFMAGVASYYDTGISLAIVGSLLAIAGPSILFWQNRHSQLTSIAIAASSMGLSALLIHLGRGAIEMHFHIFVLLALLITFGKAWPILTAAAIIAVHHLAFWVFLPSSVFDHPATFGTVALHAFFVIVESIPAIFIAQRLGKAIRSEGIIQGHLQEATRHVLTAASQIRTNGENLSQDTQKQAAIIEETSAASEDINTKTQSTAQKSKAMSSLMANTENAITRTSQAMNQLASHINGIDQSMESMFRIIKVIDSVAFQTNILALNAAVEAARAGEAGLGFSVVADEVRRLAQNCTDAAKQTSELIQDSCNKTKQGSTQVVDVAQFVTGLITSAEKVKQLAQEVTEESEDQAQSIHQISNALAGLRDITSRNAASAEENAATGIELQSQAAIIQNTVQQLSVL